MQYISYSKVGEFDSSNARCLSCRSTTPGTSRKSPVLVVSDANFVQSTRHNNIILLTQCICWEKVHHIGLSLGNLAKPQRAQVKVGVWRGNRDKVAKKRLTYLIAQRTGCEGTSIWFSHVLFDDFRSLHTIQQGLCCVFFMLPFLRHFVNIGVR